jgi:hypothetical protein
MVSIYFFIKVNVYGIVCVTGNLKIKKDFREHLLIPKIPFFFFIIYNLEAKCSIASFTSSMASVSLIKRSCGLPQNFPPIRLWLPLFYQTFPSIFYPYFAHFVFFSITVNTKKGSHHRHEPFYINIFILSFSKLTHPAFLLNIPDCAPKFSLILHLSQ